MRSWFGGVCLQSTNRTWIGSVQGAIATWSNQQVCVRRDLEDRKIQKDFANCDGYRCAGLLYRNEEGDRDATRFSND
jgi:hypothetical protein